MADLKVLNPVAEIAKSQDVKFAPRLADLGGKVIGLYWNNKPSGNLVNQFTAELLAQQFKDVHFKEFSGSVGAIIRQASAEDISAMTKECVAVIGSLGD